MPNFGVISVWSIREGKAVRLWTRDQAGWEMWDAPLPANVKSTATLAHRTVLSRRADGRQRLVLRERDGSGVTLREVAWKDGNFSTCFAVTGHELQALALDREGRML